MTRSEAIAFVKRNGIALESAQGPVPNLAEAVAGEPIRRGWWSHLKSKEIFLLSRAVRESPDVLVCRLINGKVTYVHRRIWPALVSMAGKFRNERLAALKEIHTPSGKHEVLVTPFPDWVPKEVLRAARKLTEKEAASQMAVFLDTN